MTRRTRPAGPAQPAAAKPFNEAFSSLRERLPDGYSPPAADPTAPRAPRPPARAVVRLERKGRAGKEATIVEKLALDPAELARWADELKRALGCGGGVEGEAVVVQGDQRERVVRWLGERGVGRIVRG